MFGAATYTQAFDDQEKIWHAAHAVLCQILSLLVQHVGIAATEIVNLTDQSAIWNTTLSLWLGLHDKFHTGQCMLSLLVDKMLQLTKC